MERVRAKLSGAAGASGAQAASLLASIASRCAYSLANCANAGDDVERIVQVIRNGQLPCVGVPNVMTPHAPVKSEIEGGELANVDLHRRDRI